MADEQIIAGYTPEQADAHIATLEAKIGQIEETLRLAKANLRAARSARTRLQALAQAASGVPHVTASAGAAEATGEARS